MINLHQLQIFVAVGERGSFSAAAEELKLTQPGVSQHIHTLEETYKVRLFIRNGPHIELTEAGQRLLEAARALVQQAEHLEENFSAELGDVRGKISLIYSKNTGTTLYFLPPLMSGFREKFGGVSFSLMQATEETALALLLERESHFALVSSPPRQKSLESLLVHTDELVLVLPPGHPWHGATVELKDLKGQPFLLRASGSETRRVSEKVLRAAGLSYFDLQLVAELDSAEAVVTAAQAGLGIGFASAMVVERFAGNATLGCARLRLPEKMLARGVDLKREVYLTRLTGTTPVERWPSQERFWEYVKSQIGA